MSILLFTIRLLLAIVFAVAGLAKLADRAGSRQAVIDFGLPAAIAGQSAILLPLAEISVAVALIPGGIITWIGALAALVLLLLFIAGISVSLMRGHKPNCHCFGQLYSAPVSAFTLVRNCALAVIAALVVWQGYGGNTGPGFLDWLADLTTAEIVLLVVMVLVLAVLGVIGRLLVDTLAQNGRLLSRVEALEKLFTDLGMQIPQISGNQSEIPALPVTSLPVGTPAPAFSLPNLVGETISLDTLRASGKPVMLIFTDPGCGPCTALLPDISRWQTEYAAKLTIALISRGASATNLAKSAELKLTDVLLQKNREVAEAYQVHGTPSAVIVKTNGTIGCPLASGALAINDLLARTVGLAVSAPIQTPTAAPRSAINSNGSTNGAAVPQALGPIPPSIRLKLGEQAPALKLPDLNGKMIDLADFRGSKTLVLFWNPGCGFCRRMLDDLKAWETNGAPKVLIISTGSVDDNRAMGLRSPVLLEPAFSIGRAFGATGTPSAVMIDARGNIASDLAAGTPAVLALGASFISPTAINTSMQ